MEVIWSHPFIHRWQAKWGQAWGETNSKGAFPLKALGVRPSPSPSPETEAQLYWGSNNQSTANSTLQEPPRRLHPSFLGFVICGLWGARQMGKKMERSQESHRGFWFVQLKRQLSISTSTTLDPSQVPEFPIPKSYG